MKAISGEMGKGNGVSASFMAELEYIKMMKEQGKNPYKVK